MNTSGKMVFVRKLILFVLCCIGGAAALAQNAAAPVVKKGVFMPLQKSDIQQVQITDTLLLNRLHQFIAENKKDTLFNTMGYVAVGIGKQWGKISDQSSIRFSLYLHLSTWNLKMTDRDDAFPNYYTIVDNKLVAFYAQGLNRYVDLSFSAKSKKKFIAVLHQYAPHPKPIKFRFPDEHGKKTEFEDYNVYTHSNHMIIEYTDEGERILND